MVSTHLHFIHLKHMYVFSLNLNLFAVKSNTLNRLFLIAESLSTLQAADTSQALVHI